jgi:predicted transcriptional regulator
MVDFECLVAILGRLESKIDAEQEKLEACHGKLKVSQEKIAVKVEACLEKMEANQEKEAKMEAYPGKVEAMVEHYDRASHVKAMQVLTALQDQASDVLHKVCKGVTYEETVGATENMDPR